MKYTTTYTSLCHNKYDDDSCQEIFEIKKSEDLTPIIPSIMFSNIEKWQLIDTSVNETHIFWTWQLDDNF